MAKDPPTKDTRALDPGSRPSAKAVALARQIIANRAKDDVIHLRIPAAHKRSLVEAAAREGLELSAWLRQVALRAAGVLPQK